MAKRHIQVPAAPATFSDPVGRTISATWQDVMSTFFRDGRFLQAMDYEERARVRAAFLKTEPGSVLVIDEEQWKVVAEIAKRPATINPDLFDGEGGVEMFDAIRNATTKHPHDKQAKGAGLSTGVHVETVSRPAITNGAEAPASEANAKA